MASKEDQKPKPESVEAATTAYAKAASVVTAKFSSLFTGDSGQAADRVTEKGENEAAKLQHEEKPTELREWKAKCARLEKSERAAREDAEDMAQDVAFLIDERDNAQAETHQTNKVLHIAEANCRKLQEQVAQFKKVISSSSQTENQVADDVIRAKSEQLFYDIQEFVVKTFKGVKFDFSKLPKGARGAVRQYAPFADNLPKGYWLNIITNIISQVMLLSFTPRKFFGRDDSCSPVALAINIVKTFGDNVDPKWLIATRKLLSEKAGGALQAADRQCAEAQCGMLHDNLHRAIAIEWSPAVCQRLIEIFMRAQDFYRLMCSQQSQLQTNMLHAVINDRIQVFNPGDMEAVNVSTEDESEVAGKLVEVSVFPMVLKRGEDGTVTVLSKAKVVPRME